MAVPTTLSGLRASCGEPLCALEACSICTAIPKSCWRFVKGDAVEKDNIPPAVEKLVPFIGEIGNRRGEVKQCPECHRVYFYEYEYEFLVPASEETYSYRRVDDVEELFRSEWFSVLRLDADPQFAGRAYITVDKQTFFRRHAFVAKERKDDKPWVVLFDEAPLVVISGRLDVLARVAAAEPPEGLSVQARAVEYATFADRVTSECEGGFLYVDDFDKIPFRGDLSDEDRSHVADLRAASRVEPMQVERQGDAFVIRRWVVARQRLIRRALTVLPTAELLREDTIVGERIPIDPKKRWGRILG